MNKDNILRGVQNLFRRGVRVRDTYQGSANEYIWLDVKGKRRWDGQQRWIWVQQLESRG
jgi:hypothetical protein